MKTKTKQWADGSSATIQYDGQGDGNIIITSDANSLYEARSMQITVETTDGSGIQRIVIINQAAKQRIDLSAAMVTAATQTYSGSAKTPTPTVTLNGTVIPSTGYDVAYSNNTSAGTANITITGKGDYTGTAYGTFTINKATPSYTAPAIRSLTYNDSSQYLTTSGSTSHGTIYYSTDGVNWYASRRTAINAGSYNCYWKLVGDSNHTDISSTYLGTTSIAKASRTISWSSYPSVLNVGESDSLSAYVSAGSGDGSISFSSSNNSVASVSGSTVTAVGTGSCTIYASVSEGTNYKSASTSYSLTVSQSVDPILYVDMGLPSGTKWAKTNLDETTGNGFAASEYQYECSFYSWGNTVGHNPTSVTAFSYDWGNNNYGPYASTPGATISGNIGLSNDAARQILGSPWRMPTKADFEELFNNCDFVDANGNVTTNCIVVINNIWGCRLKSKINGNILFLPCSGYGEDSSWKTRTSFCHYWSSTLYSSGNHGYNLTVYSGGAYPSTYHARYMGLNIRPVFK